MAGERLNPDWLGSLPETQRAIVILLKGDGRMQAKELASRLYMTVGGVRHQVGMLLASGLVVAESVSTRRGRPSLEYSLTPEGENLFADGHRRMARDVVGELREFAPELLDLVLRNRVSRKLGEAREVQARTNTDAMGALLVLLENDGYMPELEVGPESARITLRHCPVLDAARASSSICRAEVELMNAVLNDRDVALELHRIAGDQLCTAVITRK